MQTILIVDDDPHSAEMLVAALRQSDVQARVEIVHTLTAACDHLRVAPTTTDLIFLDLNLPDSPLNDTVNKVATIAAMSRGGKVVVFSGYEEAGKQVAAAGGEFLPKGGPTFFARVAELASKLKTSVTPIPLLDLPPSDNPPQVPNS